MGGLYKLFLKITPIIMLICFICFGITHTFDPNETTNLTYLGHENVQFVVYTRDPDTQQITTETKTQKIYTFDMESYANNLNQNILQRATSNIFDLDTYTNVLNTFNLIWDDGYQALDGIQTAINAVILVINTLILPINVFLTPFRICCGIILTGISAVGIRTDRNTPIITALNKVIDHGNFKLIPPTYNAEYHTSLENTTWIFNTTIGTQPDDTPDIIIPIGFTEETHTGNYIKFVLNYQDTGDIYYVDIDNNWIKVYDHTYGWLYQTAKTITITNTTMTNEYDYATMVVILQQFATQVV